MDSNAKFESEVLGLLRRLNEKKEKIQAQFTKELVEIDRQIQAIQITAQLMRDPALSATEGSHPLTVLPAASDLRGKSVRQACIEIAKQHRGVLKIADAARVLLNAGVIRHKKHAWALRIRRVIGAKSSRRTQPRERSGLSGLNHQRNRACCNRQ